MRFRFNIQYHFASPQKIPDSCNSIEQKRLLMDLDINMRTVSFRNTVTFYGALYVEVMLTFISTFIVPQVWYNFEPCTDAQHCYIFLDTSTF